MCPAVQRMPLLEQDKCLHVRARLRHSVRVHVVYQLAAAVAARPGGDAVCVRAAFFPI